MKSHYFFAFDFFISIFSSCLEQLPDTINTGQTNNIIIPNINNNFIIYIYNTPYFYYIKIGSYL